jgi:hypothetical protein
MATVLYEYAAKFICGVQKDREDLRLTPGVYGTEINVHNPNDHTVRFRKKLALTFPPGEQRPGEILRFPEEDYLRPDQALAVDCNHVRAKLFGGSFPAPGYITGFIVIESTASLDVTAVYTTAALDEQGQVIDQRGIDVEQIHERQKPGQPELPDLIPVPDETGSFCNQEDGALLVTVKNQGTAPAGPSTTQVDFFKYGQISLPTPPLGAGQVTSPPLAFPIPPGCFDKDCEFRITVDLNNDVAESNEANNTADGVCTG